MPELITYRHLQPGPKEWAAFQQLQLQAKTEDFYVLMDPVPVLRPDMPGKNPFLIMSARWGIFSEGEIIGCFGLSEDMREEGLVVFNSAYLKPEHRGRKLFAETFPLGMGWARQQGFTTAQVMTSSCNMPVIKLCEKHGFTQYAETAEDLTWTNGHKARCRFYRRDLVGYGVK